MAVDQRQVVVQPGVERPDPARRVAGAVVAVEQSPQARDGTVEVATNRAIEVGRAGERRQVADIALDAAGDMGFSAPRESIDAVHPAHHAHVSQKIALEIGEGIPVAQDLRAIRATPYEIGGFESFREQLGARSRQGKGRPAAIVAANEMHAVNARDGCHVEAQRDQHCRQRRRMAEVVGQIG